MSGVHSPAAFCFSVSLGPFTPVLLSVYFNLLVQKFRALLEFCPTACLLSARRDGKLTLVLSPHDIKRMLLSIRFHYFSCLYCVCFYFWVPWCELEELGSKRVEVLSTEFVFCARFALKKNIYVKLYELPSWGVFKQAI